MAHLALNRIGALAVPIHEPGTRPSCRTCSGSAARSPRSSFDLPRTRLSRRSTRGLRPQLPELKQVFAIGAPNPQADAFGRCSSAVARRPLRRSGRSIPMRPATSCCLPVRHRCRRSACSRATTCWPCSPPSGGGSDHGGRRRGSAGARRNRRDRLRLPDAVAAPQRRDDHHPRSLDRARDRRRADL